MILRRIAVYLLVGLVSIVFLMSFIAPTPSPAVTVTVDNINQTVTIEAKPGAFVKEFNIISVVLEKNTEYIITFKVPDVNFLHNLIIDEDGDVAEANAETPDSADTRIGVENNFVDSGGVDTWSVLWTSPDQDVTITGFCGFTGHFATMKLDFVIGEGSQSLLPSTLFPGFELIAFLIPGFELVVFLAGLGFIGVVVLHKRK